MNIDITFRAFIEAWNRDKDEAAALLDVTRKEASRIKYSLTTAGASMRSYQGQYTRTPENREASSRSLAATNRKRGAVLRLVRVGEFEEAQRVALAGTRAERGQEEE